MSVDFRSVPVPELARQVRSRELSARELALASLARIEELNPLVNAFVALDATRTLREADRVDQLVAAGADPGPLAGVPIGVKDNEDAFGYPTTHGSTLFATAPKATNDSVLVARLRGAGAVVVGKTNLPELAWSGSTTSPLFGVTNNPWQLEHNAGGSSGGSAAAVAAGMVPLATGSDGGGSIRIPSACCGLFGMKPSHGRIPAAETLGAHWLGLSTKGVIGRSVPDVVAALEAAVGPDPSDLRSLPLPHVAWHEAVRDPSVPARVAWSETLGYATIDREVLAVCEQALGVLGSLGAEVVEVDPLFEGDPVDDWDTIVGSCLLTSLEPHRDHLDAVTRGLLALARRAGSLGATALVRSLERCQEMNARLVDVFRRVGLLVTPTTAGAAPPNELQGRGMVDGAVVPEWVRMTYPFNMTRSPAATVFCGLTSAGLPVGIQLVGPQHADAVVLRCAAALEAALGFTALAPVGVEHG